MKLYEDGLIDLDDSIDSYLLFKFRNHYFPEKPITFRVLLNHNSGLADITSTGLVVPLKVGRPENAICDSEMSNPSIHEIHTTHPQDL